MSAFDLGGLGLGNATQLANVELPSAGLSFRYGDRITPEHEARSLHGDSLPSGTVLLDSPDRNGQVVINCPLTNVPMTRTMMQASGICKSALQLMVDQRAPLGISQTRWNESIGAIWEAFEKSGLTAGEVTIKVGGSSTHGFSSRATAERKKSFPVDAQALRTGLDKRFSRHVHFDPQEVEDLFVVGSKTLRLVTMSLPRPPKAPWHGILHALGLEKRPDVDVQVHSEVIDQVMQHHPGAHEHRSGDMWDRWPHREIEALFPEIRRMREAFHRNDIPVDFEFLAGVEGRKRMDRRTDWWTVASNRRAGAA